jgi:cyclophilin family peptidyl-prolyl cis-trans isomerase
LVPGLRHTSPQVRSTVAGALVGLLGAAAQPHIMPLLRDTNLGVRNKVTEMLGDLETGAALERLTASLADTTARSTRVFAASGLEKMRGSAAPAVPTLVRALGDGSDAVAAGSAGALGAIGASAAAAAPALARAYDRWNGPAEGDTRIAAVNALAALVDSTEGMPLQDTVRIAFRSIARRALTDPEPRVRDAVRTALRKALGDAEVDALARASRRVRAPRAARRVAPPAAPYESMRSAHAVIRTERGEIRLRLFPDDAPQTVANFAALADRGYFDGLVVHRVVPNFVIQDGDPDSTGWGGPGYAIPDEFNRHRYLTGTLGMALSGPDTGGSQWFITHSPQPHLDGRYTVFGEVVDGMDVVNATEESDRILSIRVVPRRRP